MGQSKQFFSSIPINNQLRHLEIAIPIILCVHGLFVLSYVGGETWQFVSLICMGLLSVPSLFTSFADRQLSIVRLVTIFLLCWILMYTTGGTRSFLSIWYFLLAPTYALILQRPYALMLPLILATLYLALIPFSSGGVPLFVVLSRVGMFVFTAYLVRALAQQYASQLEQTLLRLQLALQAGGMVAQDFSSSSGEVEPEFLNSVIPEDQILLKKIVAQALTSTEQHMLEFCVHGDGDKAKHKWRALHLTGMLQNNAKQPQVMGILQNITERKKIEAERLRLAVQTERAETIENVIQGLSHDLKTPLTIIGTSLYLLENESLNEQQSKRIETIHRQINRLNTSIQDILTVASLQYVDAVTQQPVSINKVIQEICSSLESIADHEGKVLSTQLEENVPLINGSYQQLYRALENLVHNAINYTQTGDEIQITTQVIDEHVMVRVADTGIGIASFDQQKIFERFYRSDDAQLINKGGSGLGLTIVQRVVELHRGRIEVESTVGEGSAFSISLPLQANI